MDHTNWNLSTLVWQHPFRVSFDPALYQVVDENTHSLSNYSLYTIYSWGNKAQLLSMALVYKALYITSHVIKDTLWKVNPGLLPQKQSLSCPCLEELSQFLHWVLQNWEHFASILVFTVNCGLNPKLFRQQIPDIIPTLT